MKIWSAISAGMMLAASVSFAGWTEQTVNSTDIVRAAP